MSTRPVLTIKLGADDFFIWYSMMATWRLFRPLKTFYFSRNSNQIMSLLFSRSLPRFRDTSRRFRPEWPVMTCSMLIMTRVKFLKVANETRIEKFYDLEPNYLAIRDQIRRQNWMRKDVRFEKRHQPYDAVFRHPLCNRIYDLFYMSQVKGI